MELDKNLEKIDFIDIFFIPQGKEKGIDLYFNSNNNDYSIDIKYREFFGYILI